MTTRAELEALNVRVVPWKDIEALRKELAEVKAALNSKNSAGVYLERTPSGRYKVSTSSAAAKRKLDDATANGKRLIRIIIP